MNYYIKTDLKTSKIYIAPFKIERTHLYLIEFDSRYQAENFLKKLTSTQKKDPLENPKGYTLIREDRVEWEKKMEVVKIYLPLEN